MSEALSLNDPSSEVEYDLGSMPLEELIELYEKMENDRIDLEKLNEIVYEICDVYMVENNEEKVFEWKLKAAEKGIVDAQASVAEMYDEGRGVSANYEKALYWLIKAAEGGDLESQILLGWYYEKGKGMDQPNNEMSFKWYKQAADFGVVDAIHRCGYSLLKIGDAQGAMSWFIKGLECRDGPSMVELAEMYRSGEGVVKDMKKSFEYYEMAAKVECRRGLMGVGTAYQFGFGVGVNFEKARHYFELGALQNCPGSMNNLADMYWKGEGVERNFQKALEWVKKSIELGSYDGIATYGEMILAGDGVEQDYNKAFENFKIASENNCSFAHALLGRMYENGWGCEKDISKAFLLYLKGAKEYDEAAVERLESTFKTSLYKKSFHLCDVVITTEP
ncbi:predicted protein [Naegleria gruberi]|uniref:Predicted protein n=1 Tax=Naegleria gruberi TaxID=5762 RepID=D2VAY7_NAEGR|nr:uncharacterized protein NAEGRDRAFT_66025 [Naegleria gruberi]EFC46031.1 predicted protein [Naegleria gruberi]|eukprot:XP_002678775.1 predicted protein [Naegleria gruberi strain NEG-M]